MPLPIYELSLAPSGYRILVKIKPFYIDLFFFLDVKEYILINYILIKIKSYTMTILVEENFTNCDHLTISDINV
jgi:hypothetical protein